MAREREIEREYVCVKQGVCVREREIEILGAIL